MANGDKPPGGNVSVLISSADVSKSITIPCHTAAESNMIAGEVISVVEAIAKKYEQEDEHGRGH